MLYKYLILLITFIFFTSCSSMNSQKSLGQLRVGFDIDETVLHSQDNFAQAVKEKIQGPKFFEFINTHDEQLSKPKTPVVKLVKYFHSQGHKIYFITARAGQGGEKVGEYLTKIFNFSVKKGENLFFSPKETDKISGKKFTTKHRVMKRLGIDLYYGDSDTDIVAALKASAHPVRVIRSKKALKHYPHNHFGNINEKRSDKSPFGKGEFKKFIRGGVGPYGETIYSVLE